MAAKQASTATKRTSMMLGNDSDGTQFSKHYHRDDEQRLASKVKLTKLFPMITQADRSGGLRVWGDSKTKSGPKPKQLVT